jgi:HSP20 family protein
MSNNFYNLMTRPTIRSARSLEDLFGLTSHMWSGTLNSDESAFLPSVDVQESPTHWAVVVDVPGVKKEDLSIEVEGLKLSISGERHDLLEADSDKGSKRSHVERRFGKFSRSFTLPEQVETEAIKADHRDGVLKVVIPKKPAATKKTIEIGTD